MRKVLSLNNLNLVCAMLVASIALYYVQYLIWGKGLDVLSGFLGNLAFLPVYVTFVTLMIERIMKERDKVAIRQKMNMVIGIFFSEIGTGLLRDFSCFLTEWRELAAGLDIGINWTGKDFDRALEFIGKHQFAADCSCAKLPAMKDFLIQRRNFLLGLLENPNLLEHEEITDLLWAVSHLTEELAARRNLDLLSRLDLYHLSVDIQRVYRALVRQWVLYMKHLGNDYPYLFSLAVRMNPLKHDAHAELG